MICFHFEQQIDRNLIYLRTLNCILYSLPSLICFKVYMADFFTCLMESAKDRKKKRKDIHLINVASSPSPENTKLRCGIVKKKIISSFFNFHYHQILSR